MSDDLNFNQAFDLMWKGHKLTRRTKPEVLYTFENRALKCINAATGEVITLDDEWDFTPEDCKVEDWYEVNP